MTFREIWNQAHDGYRLEINDSHRVIDFVLSSARRYMLMLLSTVIFIFAIVAMNLFAGIRPAHPAIMGDLVGFDTLGMSMMTLFGIATGDAVRPIVQDCLVQWPQCCDAAHELLGLCGDMEPGGCGTWLACVQYSASQ